MTDNRSSVSHTIRAVGYKYDIIKGELSKGSTISKSVHPLSEVEAFKKKLFERKLLKDMGTHWGLKKNIRTGFLMSVNLHAGQLIKESPYKQDIVVSESEAAEIKDKLQEKQVCVSNSEIVMKSIRDTLRFSSINILEVNADIFSHHGSDTFGPEERFVLKTLQERGVVSPSARHGLSGEKEADIVDDVSGDQYEIIYEFKTELSKKKMKPHFIYSPEILTLQLVNSPFIHTSKALNKKFKKEYTDRYRPNLVILTLGTQDAIITMLDALSNDFKKEGTTELNYSNVYIISLDFLDERAIFFRISSTGTFLPESFLCKNDELGFVKLSPIKLSTMGDEEKYLMVCKGIFDETKYLRYATGKELKSWIKKVSIWGV